jgi:hypothetical protein
MIESSFQSVIITHRHENEQRICSSLLKQGERNAQQSAHSSIDIAVDKFRPEDDRILLDAKENRSSDDEMVTRCSSFIRDIDGMSAKRSIGCIINRERLNMNQSTGRDKNRCGFLKVM